MGLEKQGAKPTGLIGKIIGRLMNRYHTSFYINYFSSNLPVDNSTILDIGCGGGKFLNYLSNENKSYMLYGLDHSIEMVNLAQKINNKVIEQGRLKIYQGSVIKIPMGNASLNMVTAFETVQFWSDIDECFSEIFRVLKRDGKLIIINIYPPEGSKWWKIAKLKSEKDYQQRLQKAGFSKMDIDLSTKKGYIIVNAIK